MSDSTIKCDKCDEEFVDSESFESHKEMSHENDSFQFIDSRNAVDEEEFVRRNSTKGYNPNPNAGLYDNKLFREGSAKERTSMLGEANEDDEYEYGFIPKVSGFGEDKDKNLPIKDHTHNFTSGYQHSNGIDYIWQCSDSGCGATKNQDLYMESKANEWLDSSYQDELLYSKYYKELETAQNMIRDGNTNPDGSGRPIFKHHIADYLWNTLGLDGVPSDKLDEMINNLYKLEGKVAESYAKEDEDQRDQSELETDTSYEDEIYGGNSGNPDNWYKTEDGEWEVVGDGESYAKELTDIEKRKKRLAMQGDGSGMDGNSYGLDLEEPYSDLDESYAKEEFDWEKAEPARVKLLLDGYKSGKDWESDPARSSAEDGSYEGWLIYAKKFGISDEDMQRAWGGESYATEEFDWEKASEVTSCPTCNGTGEITMADDYSERLYTEECIHCGGTGRIGDDGNESYAKEDDYKYDFDELSSLAQDKIEDGHISQLEWDDSSKEERKDIESVLHGDESDEDGTMLHGSGWNSGAETEPIESNDYLEARDQAISKALKAPIEVEDDYEKVDYEKEDELSAGFIEEQHTERTEDKNKFLDDIDISLENIDYVYPTKIGEAIGKSYITEAIEGLDEEYEGLEDSDEEEVIELVTERKMGGFSNESIARELHITYGVSPEYALSRVHGIEVSTNDKVANTFFGKKYKDCTESEKDELRMYSGSDY